MISLLRKEISSFFNSIIGYLAIILFLGSIGLFMWIFPGDLNVMDGGYANLNTLFTIAPWVFSFLAPAITMKSFAEEKKTGTIEFLATKPLTSLQIVMAKYLASFVIIVISLLPTLIYYLSVLYMAYPAGNVDSGAFWGSFIGLFFLGAAFLAVGIFTSSITNNQIVAFIIGIVLCLFVHIGFELFQSIHILGKLDSYIPYLGMNYHYNSLSRGVVDTRDLIYFLSVVALFLISTKIIMEDSKK